MKAMNADESIKIPFCFHRKLLAVKGFSFR